MEDDHTASFLSALANLQPQAGVEGVGVLAEPAATAEELASLDGWSTAQLKDEVIRLRRALGQRERREIDHEGTADAILQSHLAFSQPFVPVASVASVPVPVDPPPEVSVAGRKRPADEDYTPRKPTKRDEGTGKRVERGRRVELGRAIRTKMRMAMNIGMDDPLPPPSAITAPDAQPGDGFWVPNWILGLGDAVNSQWLDRVCLTFIAEARAFQGWAKVPPEDLDEEVVKAAARTAFMNFSKRYMAEVDPKHAKRKEKYDKNRRRWARKDLKQKRRSKAALDPSFTDTLPASALHIDYMSSEYSSAGENDAEETQLDDTLADQRRSHWLETLHAQTPDTAKRGKGGWADGQSEKVLEVRTPTWRSARLDDIYRRLDTVSAVQAALRATPASQQGGSEAATPQAKPASLRLGHVAPSHRRFTMPPHMMRRGRTPKDTGESWMWASGQAGVWPASEREVVQAVDAVTAVQAANGLTLGEVEAAAESAVAVELAAEGVHDAVDAVQPLDAELDPSVDALVEGWTEAES